jgi:flavin-dependent dehydrogenase
MSVSDNSDIIIVGAGPAGLSTALHLAQVAPDLVPHTLIFEKAVHPRHKLCGGGLLADAEFILQGLGLDVSEVPHVDVDWARFDFEGQGMRMRAEKDGFYAFRTIRRHEFDAWLADKARERGFRILEDTQVLGIQVLEQGVRISTNQGEFQALVVVGADGSSSVVRRAIIPVEKLHVARLLEVVTPPCPERSFHRQQDSYFDFLVVPQGIHGYTWDFPAVEAGHPLRVRGIFDANLNPGKEIISLQAALHQELERHGQDISTYRLEGAPLRWFSAHSKFSSPRLLLAGDAAGADALFGEGISIALGYGQMAADAIRDAFARQDFSMRTYKADILRSSLGRALRRRTWLAHFYYRLHWSWFQAFAWRRMGWLIAWLMRSYFIGWAKRR